MPDQFIPSDPFSQSKGASQVVMNGRRSFLQKTTALGMGAFGLNSLFEQLHARDFAEANKWLEEAPFDNYNIAEEDYWAMIQQAYSVNPEIINLNNGGVSPAPRVVQEAVE